MKRKINKDTGSPAPGVKAPEQGACNDISNLTPALDVIRQLEQNMHETLEEMKHEHNPKLKELMHSRYIRYATAYLRQLKAQGMLVPRVPKAGLGDRFGKGVTASAGGVLSLIRKDNANKRSSKTKSKVS